MTKIIISLAIIAVVGAVVVGSTTAFFSASKTSPANTFTAATVDINLDGDGDSQTAYFDVNNMVPGDEITKYVMVKNDSNIDLLFRGYLTQTTNTEVDGQTFADQLEVEVILNPTDIAAPAGYVRFDPYTDTVIFPDPYHPEDGEVLSSLIGPGSAHSMDNVPQAFDDPDNQAFHPDEVAIYKVTVSLPWATSNDWQGAQFIGDLVFEAVQFEHQDSESVQW